VSESYRVDIENLPEFVRGLRRMSPEAAKQIRKVHYEAAKLVSDRARSAAPARVRTAIKPQASARSAKIATVPSSRAPDALVRFWGTKKRTGWYASPRYSGSTTQHPRWVGNQWDPGETGGRPYFIGPAINASIDEVEDMVLDAYEKAARESGAFRD